MKQIFLRACYGNAAIHLVAVVVIAVVSLLIRMMFTHAPDHL